MPRKSDKVPKPKLVFLLVGVIKGSDNRIIAAKDEPFGCTENPILASKIYELIKEHSHNEEGTMASPQFLTGSRLEADYQHQVAKWREAEGQAKEPAKPMGIKWSLTDYMEDG